MWCRRSTRWVDGWVWVGLTALAWQVCRSGCAVQGMWKAGWVQEGVAGQCVCVWARVCAIKGCSACQQQRGR